MENIILSYPFVIVLIIISFAVQWKVKHVMHKFHSIQNSAHMNGKMLAEKMLSTNGIQGVTVKKGEGKWVADFYDPKNKLVNLSPDVYDCYSITSLAIAAHEVGHAIQDHTAYFPLKLRGMMYPLARFGSQLGTVLLIAGIFLQLGNLFTFGIFFYALSVIFTVLNLPVEFDASARAKTYLSHAGYLQSHEEKMVSQLLWAAAMTYVMAALIAVIELLRMIALSRRD